MSNLEKAIELAKETLKSSHRFHDFPENCRECIYARALLSLAEENETLKAERLATPTEFAHAIDASIIAKLRAQESELTALKSELAEAERIIDGYAKAFILLHEKFEEQEKLLIEADQILILFNRGLPWQTTIKYWLDKRATSLKTESK